MVESVDPAELSATHRTVHSVERNHRVFDDCPIRAYLGILTEKAARAELQAAARTVRETP